MYADEPFALLITWTCYGTWLPGDRRGYISSTLRPDGSRVPKQNLPGGPIAADDSFTREVARAQQREPAARLTAREAGIVAQELVAAAAARRWRILRAAIMHDHVHVVVTECPDDGSAARRVFKGTTQAALRRSGCKRNRWWTHGGSDRYLRGEQSILAAVPYVADQRGKLAEVVDMEVATRL